MMLSIRGTVRPHIIQSLINSRRFSMTWETPHAIDFRFGMEITMYIANR